MTYDDVPQIINEFLEYQIVIKGRSYNTVKEYHYELKKLSKFLKQYKLNNGKTNNINLDSDISVYDLDINFFKSVTTDSLYDYLSYLNSEFIHESGNINRFKTYY